MCVRVWGGGRGRERGDGGGERRWMIANVLPVLRVRCRCAQYFEDKI